MSADKINYADMVATLVKPGQAIIDQMTPDKAHQWHMASCVCGEAGELFDAVKKSAIYNKPIDMTNVEEELGDIEFYLEGLRQSLGITREQTLDANVAKLSKRYEGLRYTDAAAQARADKQEIGMQQPLSHQAAQGITDAKRALGGEG